MDLRVGDRLEPRDHPYQVDGDGGEHMLACYELRHCGRSRYQQLSYVVAIYWALPRIW